MSNLVKLLFAVLLGVIAGALNWIFVSSRAQPPKFVAAAGDLKPGQSLGEDDLVAVPVPGDLEQLKKSLIPFSNRAILFGVPAPRTYAAGDVFFQRDIQPPVEQSQWDVIGPFRLISVGARFKAPDQATEAYANDSSRNNVTIEVSADFDQRTRRLLEVIGPSRSSPARGAGSQIVAVQVLPSKGSTVEPSSQSEVDRKAVYQTVSLEGIANVPRVLLAGDMIRFVVPAPTEYE